MSETNPAPTRLLGGVFVSHLGYNCGDRKTVVVRGASGDVFEVRDMSAMHPAAMGERETYVSRFTGRLRTVETPIGVYSWGDFSGCSHPGIYQVVLPKTGERSYQFAITDGAYGWLPSLFLGFVHNWRSGNFENSIRSATHLDDGAGSRDGRRIDAVGGWYDAGDLRKWMVHSNLPALAFMEAHDALPWRYADWERVDPGWSPWLLEARWGLDFMLKMQDPRSGMFYEDVGGGGGARKRPGMTWWYENHSGCYADNAENRFTDNVAESGDERTVRVQYNPTAQFTSVALLARASRAYARLDEGRAARYADAAMRGWALGLAPEAQFLESAGTDFSGWTSVRSWRAAAALELHQAGCLPWSLVESCARDLLNNFHPGLGFWVNEAGGLEPYRGILHSAQPIIALARIARSGSDAALSAAIVEVLRQCVERYVVPLAELTPFGLMPFGVYGKPVSAADLYRPWRDGYTLRLFMPEHSPLRINHGLAGHWTSWAHGLALAGDVIGDRRCTDLAWKQLHWLLGCNPFNACLVSGVGFNNPMPHSRFLGTFPGGFCNGFNGSSDDLPLLDTNGDAQWNTTEYWLTPISNTLMALCVLQEGLPPEPRRIGVKAAG